MEKSGTPQLAFVGITAALFDKINNLRNFPGRNSEGRFTATEFHSQRGKARPGRRDLVAPVHRAEFVGSGSAFVHGNLVMPKVKRGTQLQPRKGCPLQNAVRDAHSVLQVGKNYSLFQKEVARMISPNRQPIFESKFSQIASLLKVKLPASPFFTAQRNNFIIAEAESFGDMIPHHAASSRRR